MRPSISMGRHQRQWSLIDVPFTSINTVELLNLVFRKASVLRLTSHCLQDCLTPSSADFEMGCTGKLHWQAN